MRPCPRAGEASTTSCAARTSVAWGATASPPAVPSGRRPCVRSREATTVASMKKPFLMVLLSTAGLMVPHPLAAAPGTGPAYLLKFAGSLREAEGGPVSGQRALV